MHFRVGFFCLLFTGIPLAAVAETPAPATSAHAISGNEIVLADGRSLQLQGIAPPFAEDERGTDEAKKGLEDLIAGHALAFEDATADRYGHLDAQVYVIGADGKKLWLQGEMLKRGLAFIYPLTGNETQLDDMRKIETAARHDQAGIWANSIYADVPAAKMWAKEGRFAFISGPIFNAVRTKNMIYLDFGEDWHKSFSVEIAAHDLHNFSKENIDLLALKGKTVRVRGWVRREPKPMMMVTSPGQIEILTQP